MSHMLLGINIDHVAALRNARNTMYPDPVHAAYIAERSGADSITVHLREDRRHITDRDLKLLRATIQTNMNLEISMQEDMIDIACSVKPNSCCLVPENRQELTTEGGLDVIANFEKLKYLISMLTDVGIEVSLFIAPDDAQICAAYNVGAKCIELHTGTYANAYDKATQLLEYERIKRSVSCAVTYNLKIHAGHGLNYYNIRPIAMIPCIQGLNIGHAIISRAVFCGLSKAIRDMKEMLWRSRGV